MKIRGLSAAIAVISLAFLALTSSINASAADRSPCADDVARFCKDIKPGKGAVIDCLEQHENELTPACRTHETNMAGKRVEMRELIRERVKFRKACRNDVNRLCSDAKPGKDSVMQCLTAHEKELSAPCAEMFKSIKNTKE